MTDHLSPAAKAVLDAYWNYPWNPARQHEDRGSIAATLRAAACQLTSAKAIDTLRTIANELDPPTS